MTTTTHVFVFGSNLAGRHGKGAALHAREHHGAIHGQGEGIQGSSYAIPTKDASIRTLPLDAIAGHVEKFKLFAAANPAMQFKVTAIGCGLAGYTSADIAPLFRGTPSNCMLPPEFEAVLAAGEAAVPSSAEEMVVLLATLPRGHDLRTRPLGEVMAECRNKLSKEWRPVARWRIAASSYDDLGTAWTDTSDFRVQRQVRSL